MKEDCSYKDLGGFIRVAELGRLYYVTKVS